MKPIVTDTYDFPTLIEYGYVYVDKTALLRRMVSGVDGRFFFMSRPRRFGKSLMISTLEQIFGGNRKLFKGLDIAKSDYAWEERPVLRLDMSRYDNTRGVGDFQRQFSAHMGSRGSAARALEDRITALATTSRDGKIVVLIDEYDSPISGLLDRPDELEEMRSCLQTIYRVLKSNAHRLHFLMMTGVSKFTKLSVFSGMNNLTDISMSPIYASLLGYTRAELERVFKPHVRAFAEKQGKTPLAIVEDILAWYDSYRFSPESEVRVCNPVSVGRALQERRFYGFWDATGSATLIVERLRKLGKLPDEIEGIKVFPKKLDVCDARTLPFATLMYQGGYLTIKDVDPSGELVLGIPNREVRLAIYDGLVDSLLQDNANTFTSQAVGLKRQLEAENPKDVLTRVMTSVFAMVPHEWKLKNEAEAKRYFLLFMKMAGADITPELESSEGRADAVVETERTVCIFEFKYGKTAKLALRQITAKRYADAFASDTRRIVTVGVNYNPKNGQVEIECGEVNGEVNSGSGEVNGKVNSTRGEVNAYVAAHPGCRRKAMAEALSIAARTLDRNLAALIAEGRLEFRGAPKNGGYYVKEAARDA